MNVPSPGSNFNFRKIEPKLTTPKPKAAIQQQAAPQASSVSSGNKLSSVAAMTTLKRGDLSVDQAQTTPSDESTETSTDDKSILEDTAEWPDDPGDLANDHELANERTEDQEEQENQAGAQRQHKDNCLDALEIRYRSRFMVLDQLHHQLAATCDFLTQQLNGRFNKP
ncbi:MAG TPA: hypothetical protein DEP36_08245 [Gammaproteobacteria bacterium]|nr:hypothetical protein [Gammaproteobacteria bacterium]